MSDINNSIPHATIVRDGSSWFVIVTDTGKYVTLESKTYLTNDVDKATRFDKNDLIDFLHYHIDDIIGCYW